MKKLLISTISLLSLTSFASEKGVQNYSKKVNIEVSQAILKDMLEASNSINPKHLIKIEEINNYGNLILEVNDTVDNNKFITDTVLNFKNKQGKEIFSAISYIKIVATRQFNLSQNHSQTDGNNKECAINLGYAPIEFWSGGYEPQKEIIFSITHELAHCLLGKEMFKGVIDWEIPIEKEQKEKINKLAMQKSINSWILMKQGVKETNPLVVYHETFADIFSILYLYQNNIFTINDVNKLFTIRSENCINLNACNYQSFQYKSDILKIIDEIKINKMEIEKIFMLSNLLANKSLLEFL